jgi:hypothetical protein
LGIGNVVSSTTPQQSSRGFIAPSATPVKKTPDITDVLEDRSKKPEVRSENIDTEVQIQQNNEEAHSLIPSNDLPVLENNKGTFTEHWRAMFEQVFASVPTIYFPLKETCPEIENNIIKVVVKNDIQKEHFEAKTREVLAFLRTHYDEQIEEIVVETNEKLETKKIIYDVKDKLLNFKEQNEEFEDFLHILDLKIKD